MKLFEYILDIDAKVSSHIYASCIVSVRLYTTRHCRVADSTVFYYFEILVLGGVGVIIPMAIYTSRKL